MLKPQKFCLNLHVLSEMYLSLVCMKRDINQFAC